MERGLSKPETRLFSEIRSIRAGVTSRMSFIVRIPTSLPPSITASRRILLWFICLAASFTRVDGRTPIIGFDIASVTFTSEGTRFLDATLSTISLSVIIPDGFPALSTTMIHPTSCFIMSFAAVIAVSDSFAIIGGLDMMSRTKTSGSVSWTDNVHPVILMLL